MRQNGRVWTGLIWKEKRFGSNGQNKRRKVLSKIYKFEMF